MELLALAGSDIAHGGEDIGILGRFLLQRVDGHNAETAGHLISVVRGDGIVKGKVVPGDAPTHHGCVGGEGRGYGNTGTLKL